MADKKPKSKLSQQRQWQLAQIKAGRCQTCGKKRQKYATRCNAHQILNRGYAQAARERAKKAAKRHTAKLRLDRALRKLKKLAGTPPEQAA